MKNSENTVVTEDEFFDKMLDLSRNASPDYHMYPVHPDGYDFLKHQNFIDVCSDDGIEYLSFNEDTPERIRREFIRCSAWFGVNLSKLRIIEDEKIEEL